MKTVIEMAREAGFSLYRDISAVDGSIANLERFAELVAAAEREAAEERVVDLFTDMETPYLPDIVAAIRARRKT